MAARQRELPFDGALWIPFHLDLLRDPLLSSPSKVTLAYLRFRQGERGDTWVKTAEIAEDLGTSLRSIRIRISELERAGLVRDEEGRKKASETDGLSFVKVPVEAFKELSPQALVVYAALLYRARGGSECWPGLRDLAALTGLSRSAVMRAKPELEARNLVSWVRRRRERGSDLYQIMPFSKRKKTLHDKEKNASSCSEIWEKNASSSRKKTLHDKEKNASTEVDQELDHLNKTNFLELDQGSESTANAIASLGCGEGLRIFSIQELLEPGRQTGETPPMTQCVNETHFWNEETESIGDSEEDEDVEHLEAMKAEAEARVLALRERIAQQDRRSNTRVQQADRKLQRVKKGLEGGSDITNAGDKKALQRALLKAATRIEEVWRAETRRFNAEFPRWGARNLGRVGYTMIDRFGVAGTERVFQYACRCWAEISKRMLRDTSPIPSLDFILRKADDLFAESSIWERFDIVKRDWDRFWQQNADAVDVPEDLAARKEALGKDYQRLGLKF